MAVSVASRKAAGRVNVAAAASRIRLLVLLTILGLLLFALWYDYQVARRGVEDTYAAVMQVNAKINASGASTAMTAKDVREVIGRSPSMVYREGPYSIEVYSWVAGLPFRSHEYYAVYTGAGTNMLFQRHYKFVLPTDEILRPTRPPNDGQVAEAFEENVAYYEMMDYYANEYEATMRDAAEENEGHVGYSNRPPRPLRPPAEFEVEEREVEERRTTLDDQQL